MRRLLRGRKVQVRYVWGRQHLLDTAVELFLGERHRGPAAAARFIFADMNELRHGEHGREEMTAVIELFSR